MKAVVLDIENADAIQSFADQLGREYPDLDVVIHSAGIMRAEAVRDGKLDDAEATVATNLLGPIRLTAALLPLLVAQPRAAIITISSGLAFMPMAATPTYNATKAAIHSFTQVLRVQLDGANVTVIELAPPPVETPLFRGEFEEETRGQSRPWTWRHSPGGLSWGSRRASWKSAPVSPTC